MNIYFVPNNINIYSYLDFSYFLYNHIIIYNYCYYWIQRYIFETFINKKIMKVKL